MASFEGCKTCLNWIWIFLFLPLAAFHVPNKREKRNPKTGEIQFAWTWFINQAKDENAIDSDKVIKVNRSTQVTSEAQ